MNPVERDAAAKQADAAPGRIAVLTYHSLDRTGSVVSVAPETFAAQMEELARLGMRGISLREAVGHRQRHGTWPGACAVLTFDDGYANVHASALPVLRACGFAATVFVVTGHVGGQNDWASPPPRLGRQPMLSWAELGELMDADIEIGSHTRQHADLRRLGADRTLAEVAGSRQDIEAQLGLEVESFAYPFGSLSEAAAGVVRQQYRSAVTTVLGRAGNAPFHALPRVDMYYVRSADDLGRTVRGERDLYLAVRRWGRRLKRLVRAERNSDSPPAFLPSAGKR